MPNHRTLFISDLHLSPAHPNMVELFIYFLTTMASTANALYILGDLFDVWIGDDDTNPTHLHIINALKTLTNTGTQLFIQKGNRDFLLGTHFFKAVGAQPLTDMVTINLYGVPTLLTHGDLLCTNDVAYHRLRRVIRNPIVNKIFLYQSLEQRRRIAAKSRQRSQQATTHKSSQIMDVDSHTVAKYLTQFRCQQLIHGHIHKHAKHEFILNGHSAQRWVLAEWNIDQILVLQATASQINFVQAHPNLYPLTS
ncbi:hypothetical protein TI04_01475 [Achromatium sp. WMS2]|nr:hypothetical protein TI04_01475 [Achromatium sp. WMS2]